MPRMRFRGRAECRWLFVLLATFALTLSAAVAQPSISIAPAEVRANTAVTLGVAPSAGTDLSTVTAAQVLFSPGDGMSLLQVVPNEGVLRVMFNLDANATPGLRTLLIVRPGLPVLSATFTIAGVSVPECPSGQSCCRRNPTTGTCISCQAICPRPFCGGNRQCCEADPNDSGRCVTCSREGERCPAPPR